MKHIRRWLAILLALVLTLGVMPMAMADEPADTAAPTDTTAPADPEKKDEETAPADPEKKDEETAPADPEKKDEETTPADPEKKDEETTPADPEKKDEETTPAAPKFTDVAATSPYAAAIDWAVAKEITLGKTETTFAPGDDCTVSHILTFLWRANGKPGAEEGVADRDSAAKWAVEKEMIAEDADLAATCTRSMAVTFMWKAAESPEVEAEKEFTDVAADAEYAGAVAWAVENEITAGTGDGSTFAPENPCNRGQIVTFLFRQLAEKETEPAA